MIVSDDGLQHHRLGRDIQVLVFDERGAGNGWLLPAGPLREPLPGALPRGTLVLYNAATASTPLPGHVARRALGRVVALADWHAGRMEADVPVGRLRGRPIVAAAGLGQPQRFFDMLASAGLQFTPLALADHHDYAELPWPPSTADVVTTEKDAVKLEPARMGATRVWVAALDFSPADGFETELIKLLDSAAAGHALEPSRRSDHGNPTA